MTNHPPLAVAPKPRPLSRRGWWVLVVIGIVIATVYAFIVAYYNAEGGSTIEGGIGPSTTPGIIVTLEPIAVDPLKSQATIGVSFTEQGSGVTDQQGRLIKSTRITLNGSNGTQEVKFPAGEPLGRYEMTIGIDGEQAYYPFDRHEGALLVSADTYERASDGALTTTGDLSVGLQGNGSVAGWDVVQSFPGDMQQTAIAVFTFDRAFSTKAFALLLLLLTMVLSIASLVIGILAFTNRRKAEVGLMAWAAGLIFALPLLRNYMPNSPPVGASIDIYIYLWVIVAAVVAAVLDIIAWVRQNRAILVAQRKALVDDGGHNAS